MRGRKPAPPELKVLKGESRPSRLRPDHAPRVQGAPEPPDWLAAEEREEFEAYVQKLDQLGVLSATDDGVIAMAAMRRVEIRELSKDIAENGHTIPGTDKNGNPIVRANPAVGQRNAAMKHLQSLEAAMGLTPSDRGRVSSSKAQDADNPYANLKRHG